MNDIKTDRDLAREIAALLNLDTDLQERGIDATVDRNEVQVAIDNNQFVVSVDPEWRSSRLVDKGDDQQ
jgi:hypothetical protein